MARPDRFTVRGMLALAVVFGAAALGEWRRPLRRRVRPLRERLLVNAVLVGLAGAVVQGLVFPASAGAARWAERRGIGLMRWLPLPRPLRLLAGFLLLDWGTYVWHRLNHRVPFLWRFHLVHHTDLDLDVTTAFRFHAGELLMAVAVRAGQAAALGVSARQMLVYEIAMQSAAAFHHSNWRLPRALEDGLLRVVVTPRMHGIHHSVVESETNSNWSVILTWWDRLHGTLRLGIPHETLTIGVPGYRDPAELGVARLLALPFVEDRPAWPRR